MPLVQIAKKAHKSVAMHVLFDTYPWAFVTPGGGEQQLLKYAQHLPGQGIEVVLHDHWNSALGAVDAVHFFSCIGGSIHFCNYVRERGLPLVINKWTDGTVTGEMDLLAGVPVTHRFRLAPRR